MKNELIALVRGEEVVRKNAKAKNCGVAFLMGHRLLARVSYTVRIECVNRQVILSVNLNAVLYKRRSFTSLVVLHHFLWTADDAIHSTPGPYSYYVMLIHATHERRDENVVQHLNIKVFY